jgi:hypothetical protein
MAASGFTAKASQFGVGVVQAWVSDFRADDICEVLIFAIVCCIYLSERLKGVVDYSLKIRIVEKCLHIFL